MRLPKDAGDWSKFQICNTSSLKDSEKLWMFKVQKLMKFKKGNEQRITDNLIPEKIMKWSLPENRKRGQPNLGVYKATFEGNPRLDNCNDRQK